jgi:hypothetical protein
MLTGQGPYLKQHSTVTGKLNLTDAVAHWWILKDEPSQQSNGGYIEPNGHVAALYQNELYEHTTGRAAMARLQQFGVTFGYKNVVIYIEPINIEHLTTNTARTSLLIKNEQLPWNEWATEFRNNLPKEIADFVAEKAAATVNTDHSATIRNRLKDILHLYEISRFKPAIKGPYTTDEDRVLSAGSKIVHSGNRIIKESDKGNSGTGGNVYSIFQKNNGTPSTKVKPDPFPEVRWVSVKNKTREPGDIEDRAGKFLTEQNLLLINADFSAFTDLVDHFLRNYLGIPGMETVVQDVVKGWFEQSLVETIIGVQWLFNRKEWSQVDIDKALSEEALTASIMQRYHIYYAIKRELASKVGARKIA